MAVTIEEVGETLVIKAGPVKAAAGKPAKADKRLAKAADLDRRAAAETDLAVAAGLRERAARARKAAKRRSR